MRRPRRPRRRSQANHVFGKEERRGELEPAIERRAVGLPPQRLGIGEHDRDSGGDHRMVHDAKHPRRSARGFGLQEPVEELAVHARL